MKIMADIFKVIRKIKRRLSEISTPTKRTTIQKGLESGIIVNINLKDNCLDSAFLTKDPTRFKKLDMSDIHDWIDCSPDRDQWKRIVAIAKSRVFENFPYRHEYFEKSDRIGYCLDVQYFTIAVSDIVLVSNILDAELKKVEQK